MKLKNQIFTNEGLRASGIRYIILTFFAYLLGVVIFFISAGKLDLPRAWIFFGIAFVGCLLVSIIINPELINQRGEMKKGIKLWDKILTRIYVIVCGITYIVMGLDVGRFQWSRLSIHFFIFGVILLIISMVVGMWAMLVNPHFESFARIQKDRDHKVISTGPYKIVRHPGYAAEILSNIVTPLIIGSIFGLIPSAIAVLTLFIRTSQEDKMLQNELNGYSEYAKDVKYKILPGIW